MHRIEALIKVLEATGAFVFSLDVLLIEQTNAASGKKKYIF